MWLALLTVMGLAQRRSAMLKECEWTCRVFVPLQVLV